MGSKKQNRRKRTNREERLRQTIERLEDRFLRMMRRPMGAHDKMFYWSYCYSSSEFKRIMIRNLLQAGIPQQLIYIYDNTGFMIDKESFKTLSKEERKEIRSAGAEYAAMQEEGSGDIYKLSDYEDSFSNEDDPLVQALYVLGNFVERNVNFGVRRLDTRWFICGYLLVRSFRIVRAIFRAKSFATSEESLVLVRSLYEIYCKLCYASRSEKNAKYLLDSDFGMISGQYDILEKGGKIKRGLLVHKTSKKIIPRHRTFFEYISNSPFSQDRALFEVLYDYLSSFVHSGSRHISRTWTHQEGFSLFDENEEHTKVFALMLTCFICALIMQITMRFKKVSSVSRWDMSLFCRATKMIISESGIQGDQKAVELMDRIKARSAILPTRMPKLKSVD